MLSRESEMSDNRLKCESVDKLENVDDIDWEQIRLELGQHEGFRQHLWRKSRENPLVPIGLTATVAALTYGVYSFLKGDRLMSQYMMRARVGAQTFTILAIVGGLLYNKPKE